MSNRLTTEGVGIRAHRSRAWLLSCLAIAVLVPTLVSARVVTARWMSGLYMVGSEDTLVVSVSEQGATDEASLVSIEIRDAANVVRASISDRSLTVGKPVILSFQVPANLRLLHLSAAVDVKTLTSADVHKPIATMEVIDHPTLTIRTLPPCAIPIDQMPSAGGGAVGSCDGWHKSSETGGGD